MTTLRRFLVLAVLLFWQGGFTFYASVVVPVGQRTFGSGAQGAVTRQVTNYLNLSGIVALVPLAWDVWATRDASRRTWRWAAWLGMAAAMPLLIWLHIQLDALMDPATSELANYPAFYPRHRLYLWISTVQWAFAGTYAVLTVAAWRAADRRLGGEEERGAMGA